MAVTLQDSPYRELAVDLAAAGDTVLVAADGQNRIQVFGLFLQAAGNTALKLLDGDAEMHGPLQLVANSYWELDPIQYPRFTLTKGKALKINQTSAVQLSGRLYYKQGV